MNENKHFFREKLKEQIIRSFVEKAGKALQQLAYSELRAIALVERLSLDPNCNFTTDQNKISPAPEQETAITKEEAERHLNIICKKIENVLIHLFIVSDLEYFTYTLQTLWASGKYDLSIVSAILKVLNGMGNTILSDFTEDSKIEYLLHLANDFIIKELQKDEPWLINIITFEHKRLSGLLLQEFQIDLNYDDLNKLWKVILKVFTIQWNILNDSSFSSDDLGSLLSKLIEEIGLKNTDKEFEATLILQAWVNQVNLFVYLAKKIEIVESQFKVIFDFVEVTNYN